MGNNFNLLRLFAAIQVFFMHSQTYLYDDSASYLLIDLLYLLPAVPIFFLVSGYLIPMSYEGNFSLKSYFRNRALRILPALYMCFVISMLVAMYFGALNSVAIKDILTWALAQLTVLQFYNPDFLRSFGVGVVNGSLWTISVELCFYLVLPLIVFMIRKSSRMTFVVLFALSVLFLAYFYYFISPFPFSDLTWVNKLFYVSILPYLFYFTFGILVYHKRDRLIPFVRTKFIYIALAYILLYVANQKGFILFLITKITFSLLIFGLAFSFVRPGRRSYNKIDLTYGIYIYHMLVINVFIIIGFKGDTLHVFTALFITVFLSMLSFFLVEKPCLKLKHISK